MKVLLVGNGGREHALARSLARDPEVTSLVCAPGNPGTAEVAEQLPLDQLDPAAVAEVALRTSADLVVVGPEAPLAAGAADAVRAAGIACFGPSAAATRIESSKSFAKQVMSAAAVPTAAAQVFDQPDACTAALRAAAPPYVVKADGLAAGKGVHVGSDLGAAIAFAREVLAAPGGSALVEDYLDGPELSLFAVTDGTTVLPLLPAQDHKRLGDGDTGPNTGGMGAYAPLPWLPEGTVEQVREQVLEPVVRELAARGTPFCGLLYAGLALTAAGPRVVEFNARFGDPETQALLPLLETPLAGLLAAAARGDLAGHPPLAWRSGAAVTVVVASAGYPGRPRLGDEVVIGPVPEGAHVLHAGTRRTPDGRLVTSGGRVLAMTGTADTLEAARALAYRAVAAVELDGAHWRTDIARAGIT